MRRRSVDSVIKEMKHLIGDYDAISLDIVDGTFTYDMRYLRDFCRRMLDENIKIKWRCTARYDNITEELLDLFKQTNCAGLYFGLESGSERMLKRINKKITIDGIIRANDLVHQSGIKSITSVLLGLPDEEEIDIEEIPF